MIAVTFGHFRGDNRDIAVTNLSMYGDFKEHLKSFQPTDWMVFTYLIYQMTPKTPAVVVPVGEIAKNCGISESTVRSAIKRLCTVKIGEQRILIVKHRNGSDGSPMENLHVLLPTADEVEWFEGTVDSDPPVNSEGGGTLNFEGHYSKPCNSVGLLNINKPPIIPPRSKKTTSMPKDDDPALPLFLAWRHTVYPELDDEYTLAEWKKAHIVLRQMVHKGVTADDVQRATSVLIRKWKNRDMVTMHALWSHWATANTLGSSGVVSQSALSAIRAAKGID